MASGSQSVVVVPSPQSPLSATDCYQVFETSDLPGGVINIVTKSGSFFSYGEERLGQGRGNAKAFLDEHPETAKEIEGKIYSVLGLGRDLVKPIESRDEPGRQAVEPVVAAAAGDRAA